jgi:hypothetical protein
MSRRLRCDSVLDLLLRVIASLNLLNECNDTNEFILDAKAMAVASHSADPDARFGRGVGAMAKGYKLHLIADSSGKIVAFAVCPLNVSEQHAAGLLLQTLRGDTPRRLLADASYDSNRLYDLAGEKNLQLIADRRYKNARSIGHQVHSLHRLEALRLMYQDPTILAPRRRIESIFGTMGNVIAGLAPLPNHVRRLHRVERWIIAKLIIHSLHRLRRQQTTTTTTT